MDSGFYSFVACICRKIKKLPYGAEALCILPLKRIQSEFHQRFIPILEETGLIIPAGRWMMKGLWENAVRWEDTFGVRMSINISQVRTSKSCDSDISAK